MIGLIISRDKDNWSKIRKKGGKRGLNSLMRSVFSFPLCSSLQTTQTAVLQLRHRRDHLPAFACPGRRRDLALNLPGSTVPYRTRASPGLAADSLSRKKEILLVRWFDLESLDHRRSLAQPTVCQRLYSILHALAYVRQPCTVRILCVLLDKCPVRKD